MARQMLGDGTAVEIVAAAGPSAHHDRDGPALVEIRDALRRARRSADAGGGEIGKCIAARPVSPGMLPLPDDRERYD